MKKLRKVFAVILSLAMVLAMSMTAFAAPALTEMPTAQVKVQNVIAGSEVTAYQIIRYDLTGEYISVQSGKPADMEAPTAEEIKGIALDIASKGNDFEAKPDNVDNLYAKKAKLTESGSEYVGTLDAGMWVVLVKSSGKTIYNPMIVSVTVGPDGITGGSVNANGEFRPGTAEVYAKHSDAGVKKTVADIDMAYGKDDDIHFTVTADVPEYSSSYKEVVYTLTDKLQGGLIYNKDSVEVKINGNDYNATPVFSDNDTKMVIDIDSDTILTASNQGSEKVVVTYTAKLTEAAKAALTSNVNPTTNKVELEYSNDPSNKDNKTKDESETFHYTFGIDADVLGSDSLIHQNFIKMAEGETTIVDGEEVKTDPAPIAGAKFELVTKNEDGTYTRVMAGTETDGTSISTTAGLTKFVGLDADKTYYLHEVEAPQGYSKVEKYVPVKFDVEFEENGKLKDGWKVIIGEGEEEKTTGSYTWGTNEKDEPIIVPPTDTENPENPYEFMNTKLASLPSTGGIGTTIFTIGGCIIMVAAAALFFASRRKSAK